MCFTLALTTIGNIEDCLNYPKVIFQGHIFGYWSSNVFFCEELASNKRAIHVLVLAFCYNCHHQLVKTK